MDLKYGPLRKKGENRLIDIERKMLRKIYGPVKDDLTGEWRQRKNIELEALYSGSDILKIVRRGKLRWTGHACKNRNPPLRAVIEQNPAGKKPLGRPKMRWEDVIKKDMGQM